MLKTTSEHTKTMDTRVKLLQEPSTFVSGQSILGVFNSDPGQDVYKRFKVVSNPVF
jgi:hypothetical protein